MNSGHYPPICKYFMTGTCHFGSKCRYRHSKEAKYRKDLERREKELRKKIEELKEALKSEEQKSWELFLKNKEPMVNILMGDMKEWWEGKVWPLSTYVPFEGTIPLPGFESDIGPDQVRAAASQHYGVLPPILGQRFNRSINLIYLLATNRQACSDAIDQLYSMVPELMLRAALKIVADQKIIFRYPEIPGTPEEEEILRQSEWFKYNYYIEKLSKPQPGCCPHARDRSEDEDLSLRTWDYPANCVEKPEENINSESLLSLSTSPCETVHEYQKSSPFSDCGEELTIQHSVVQESNLAQSESGDNTDSNAEKQDKDDIIPVIDVDGAQENKAIWSQVFGVGMKFVQDGVTSIPLPFHSVPDDEEMPYLLENSSDKTGSDSYKSKGLKRKLPSQNAESSVGLLPPSYEKIKHKRITMVAEKNNFVENNYDIKSNLK